MSAYLSLSLSQSDDQEAFQTLEHYTNRDCLSFLISSRLNLIVFAPTPYDKSLNYFNTLHI